MRVASSSEAGEPRVALGTGQRLRLLAWNSTPLWQVGVAALIAAGPSPAGLSFNWTVRLGLVLGWIFVVPPLAARLLLARWSMPTGPVAPTSAAFFKWWAVSNLQALFNRLPFLEEALRLVPGLYSAWLRLWGARVGRLTYWAPGSAVLDRPFLEVGDEVVVGAGVRLSSHMLAQDPAGELHLQVAPIRIGDGAVVGGYSVLGPGTEIAPREATTACEVFPPFSRFERGRRRRPAPAEESVSADG